MTDTYPLARWSELAVCCVPATDKGEYREGSARSGDRGSLSLTPR